MVSLPVKNFQQFHIIACVSVRSAGLYKVVSYMQAEMEAGVHKNTAIVGHFNVHFMPIAVLLGTNSPTLVL